MSFGFFTNRLAIAGAVLGVSVSACSTQAPGPATVMMGGDIGDDDVDIMDLAVGMLDSMQEVGPPDAAGAEVVDADSGDGGNASDNVGGKDAGDSDAPVDVADVLGTEDVPKDVTWTAPAWTSVCVSEGATATTLGPVGPSPVSCAPYDCALCAPDDQCTCDGDGNTGCAWKAIADLPFPLLGASHVWGDGKLFLWGGSHDDTDFPTADPYTSSGHPQTVEIWDPVANTWSVTPHAPVYSADYHMGVAYGDGKLYVGGSNVAGFKASANGFVDLPWGPTYADIAAYDVASKKWSPLPTKGSPGACGVWGGMAFVAGKLIVAGCPDIFASYPGANVGPAAAFDPSTNAWTALPNPPTGLSGKFASWQPTVVVASAVAGWGRAPDGYESSLLVFHVDTWTWTKLPSPPAACVELPNAGPFALISIGNGLFAYRPGVPPAAFVWWQEAQDWQPIPLPTWMKPDDTRQPVWTGKDVVFWANISKNEQSGVYDPTTGSWRQLSLAGQLSVRDYSVATAWNGHAVYIGGAYIGSYEQTFTDGAAVMIQGP